MILRRLTEHVKAQNWFAVALDFAIVVLGVFVATQVSNWNSTRIERTQEKQYLQRLLAEVTALIDEQEEDRAETMEVAGYLTEVTAWFSQPDSPAPAAVSPQCVAIVSSHIYAGDITLPATISELISTGRILLVRDEALRLKIVRFAQSMDAHEQLRRDIQIDRMVLSRRYPDMIRRSSAGWEETTCDFPAMAQSQAFVNDYIDNASRFEGYAKRVIQVQQDQRIALKQALEQALGLSSEGSAP